MARRRYFRYYPRTRVAKKKWASNFKSIELNSSNPRYLVLAENKAQADAPTPTIIKTGNFKVQADLWVANGASASSTWMRAYILFVPEGWSDDNYGSIVTQHPEWIMAWTVVDMPYTTSNGTTPAGKFSMTSRLKRNLNSGDKVIFYYQILLASGGNATIQGAAQFWTCAN